jgi:alpha-L-fucosidase
MMRKNKCKGVGLPFHCVVAMTAMFVALLLGTSSANGQEAYAGNKEKLAEWQADRFGMFIHWGPVTQTGKEISWSRGSGTPVEKYDQLYKTFDPVKFNADEWVSVAKAAGMKYIVLTTKHHDGFCLWPSRQTDYNISQTPYGKDVVRQLADACRRQGIKFGAYYSTTDWHNPDFPLTSPGGSVKRPKSNLDAYTAYLKRQVAELMVNYGPLYVLWFDVPQEFDKVRGNGVLNFLRSMQPDIIVNNRTGAPGDFDTPEQRVGGFNDKRPWETCMTIADQWSWKPNDKVKTLDVCIANLVRTAGGDGNFLFNVGPRPDGTIEPQQVARLKEMGQWMEQNGRTIYGTHGGPFKPTKWCVSTHKENVVFLHILDNKMALRSVSLPDIGVAVKNASVVGGGKVKVQRKDGSIVLKISKKDFKPIDTIVELTMAGDVSNVAAVDVAEVK